MSTCSCLLPCPHNMIDNRWCNASNSLKSKVNWIVSQTNWRTYSAKSNTHCTALDGERKRARKTSGAQLLHFNQKEYFEAFESLNGRRPQQCARFQNIRCRLRLGMRASQALECQMQCERKETILNFTKQKRKKKMQRKFGIVWIISLPIHVLWNRDEFWFFEFHFQCDQTFESKCKQKFHLCERISFFVFPLVSLIFFPFFFFRR